MERPPDVDEVRPSRCPVCDGASRPAGAGLGVIGHGLRERQFLGPLEADGPAQQVVLRVRRYVCRCGALLTVVPSGVVSGRRYTVPAIVLALALWGVAGLPAREVRGRTSPWRHVGREAAGRWRQLGRWVSAIRAGRLLPRARVPARGTPREHAAEIAHQAGAHALPTLRGQPPWVLAFAGGGAMT